MMDNKTGHDLLEFAWDKMFKSSIIKEYYLELIEKLSIKENEYLQKNIVCM